METVLLVAGVVTNNVNIHTENRWWCGALYTFTSGISGGVGLCIHSHRESMVM